jgi:DeoR family deoxyribose operon repressor
MGKKDMRLNALVRLLKENGMISVKELSSRLKVSVMTVRRDLSELQDNGLVVRSHGGAALSQTGSVAQYENVEGIYTLYGESEKMYEEKRRIGKFAASILKEGDVIIVDSGSTACHVVDFLPELKEFTVACFNLNIIQKLWKMEHVHILVAGGFLHRSDMMFESAEGVKFLQGIRANKVFLSASGVHEKLGLTCAHTYEVLVKQAILQSALKKILLVDSSKFGAIKTVFFAQLGEIDIVVTDSGISREWQGIITGKGIELNIV